MQFDFSEVIERYHQEVAEETNKNIEEINKKVELDENFNPFNDVLNELIIGNLRTMKKVLEEYHETLMQYLKEKDQS